MKPAVFLDTSIFAIPNMTDNVEQLDHIFSVLEAWAAKVSGQTCIDIAVMDDAISVLTEANCFPAVHNIRALLEIYELTEVFSARDINQRIFKILSRARSFHDTTGVCVRTCDFLCPEIDGLAAISPSILDGTKSLVCGLGVLLVQAPDVADIIAVVPGFRSESAKLDFDAYNVIADNTEAGTNVFHHISAAIRLCSHPDDFLRGLPAEAVWRHATDGSELALPIVIRAAEKLMIRIDQIPLPAGRIFAVGEHFFASLSKVEALGAQKHASTTLDRCAVIVADNTQIFERDFRKSRQADNAGARRVHLTKGGVGLRLMFWELADGAIEFANVGVKAALEIVEGDPANSIRIFY